MMSDQYLNADLEDGRCVELWYRLTSVRARVADRVAAGSLDI